LIQANSDGFAIMVGIWARMASGVMSHDGAGAIEARTGSLKVEKCALWLGDCGLLPKFMRRGVGVALNKLSFTVDCDGE